MMKPVDIGKAYDQITHLWGRSDFDFSNGISAHERAIAFLKNIDINERYHSKVALDVGCGCTGRLIDLLLKHDFVVEGLDISQEMINLARKKHAEICFHHEDICEWELPKKYDFITAWDSIWHIPLDKQEIVLTKLISGLNPNGIFIFSCGGIDKPDEHINNAMGPQVYYSSLGVTGFFELMIKQSCICRHFEYDQPPELHSYFIVQKI